MPLTLREVANKMDPMYPTYSLKDLSKRFRYKSQPQEISFRLLAQRLENCQQLEFLHYNTWLLTAPIDICTLIGAIGGFGLLCDRLGISVAEIITRIISKSLSADVCDNLFPPILSVCGISLNPLNDTCKLLGDVASVVNFILEKLGNALDDIIGLLGIPCDVIIDILNDLGFDIDFSLNFSSKPQMSERATEIGQQVFSYDIVSLVEVWREEERNLILEGGSLVEKLILEDRPLVKVNLGPQIEYKRFLGSGIMAFCPTQNNIIDGGNQAYNVSGVNMDSDVGRLTDSDNFATKGIQLSIVPTNFGNIDLYSTHMYSGGDMLNADWLGLGEPSDEEKAEVRRAQVSQLKDFINETHTPQHIAVIAGDFNINAIGNEYNEYGNLINTLQGFDDWWNNDLFEIHLTNVQSQCTPQETDPTGYTNRRGADNDDNVEDNFSQVCKVYPQNLLTPSQTNVNDFYCDDRCKNDNKISEGDGRIDYIFIERQTQAHTFYLDATRIRRRAFKRANNPANPEFYLSDHLGLEITFYASAK